MSNKKLIVIGGGAAGIFCAINAARLHPSLDVILLEKTSKLLSKVKVSGGGRCNVTHSCFEISEMMRKYPRGGNFVKKSFHQFFTNDTIQWFEERGVQLKTEADGRMFPITNSSQTIIDCLMKEVNRYKVEIRMNCEVRKIERVTETWRIEMGTGIHLESDYLAVACGGYPKSSMFDWLKQTGHTIEEPVPSLFTFNMPGHPITKLMGVSVEHARVRVVSSKLEEDGPLLITHWGLSGPAVLKLSAWGARELQQRNYSFAIAVCWLPDLKEQDLRERFQQLRFELASQRVSGRNSFGLPQRLWEFLLEHSFIRPDTRWADLSAKDQNKLIRNLIAGEFDIKGKTTFKEEFVTAGGIKLAEVDPSTMKSRKIDGLYFAGEILDVDGVTGGFNFQHAWTSAFIAASDIGKNRE